MQNPNAISVLLKGAGSNESASVGHLLTEHGIPLMEHGNKQQRSRLGHQIIDEKFIKPGLQQQKIMVLRLLHYKQMQYYLNGAKCITCRI